MALAPKTPERVLYLHGGRQPSECVLMAMQSMPNIARADPYGGMIHGKHNHQEP